jgi:hypothetical protein
MKSISKSGLAHACPALRGTRCVWIRECLHLQMSNLKLIERNFKKVVGATNIWLIDTHHFHRDSHGWWRGLSPGGGNPRVREDLRRYLDGVIWGVEGHSYESFMDTHSQWWRSSQYDTWPIWSFFGEPWHEALCYGDAIWFPLPGVPSDALCWHVSKLHICQSRCVGFCMVYSHKLCCFGKVKHSHVGGDQCRLKSIENSATLWILCAIIPESNDQTWKSCPSKRGTLTLCDRGGRRGNIEWDWCLQSLGSRMHDRQCRPYGRKVVARLVETW